MRMGGPREALFHAIIRKNYGCTHIILEEIMLALVKIVKGNLFYGPYDAQNLLKKHQNEIGIKMEPFKFMVYVPDKKVIQLLRKSKIRC